MKRYFWIIGIFAMLASVALASNSAFAQGGDILDRIHSQQARIHRGIENGSLTRNEADILRDNLNHIRHTYQRATEDGHISRHERDRLYRMLDENDEMISRMRHNSNVRRLY